MPRLRKKYLEYKCFEKISGMPGRDMRVCLFDSDAWMACVLQGRAVEAIRRRRGMRANGGGAGLTGGAGLLGLEVKHGVSSHPTLGDEQYWSEQGHRRARASMKSKVGTSQEVFTACTATRALVERSWQRQT